MARVRGALLALCCISIAAIGGWLVAGGSLPSVQPLVVQLAPASADRSTGGAPVHLDSTPSGAVVGIDGASRGKTPLETWLSPGQHWMVLQHPDAIDDDRPLLVADSGARLDIALWRRRPDVLPLRPVYPGASLIDARFLDDGQVSMLVDTAARSGSASGSRELWRLDPITAQRTRVSLPGESGSTSSIVLSPDGERVAYVTAGASSSLSASLWPTSGSTAAGPQQDPQPESVWLAPLDGTEPARRLFALSSASGPVAPRAPERIVDLVWTPDGSRLVAITRQVGTPTRSRVFVVKVAGAGDANGPPDAAQELVLLPAEIRPGLAVADPDGRWLALVAHAASAPGGRDVTSVCVLELQPSGGLVDLADLAAGGPAPVGAPVAWSPATEDVPERLVFVGPTPAAVSGSGLFGLFGALRPSPPPSGLFVADLQASMLADAQPRRIGTAINIFGPVWRSATTLFGFGRQHDDALALFEIDASSGAVHDLGVRLPAGTAQGGAALAARWDMRHGRALLLAQAPDDAAAFKIGGGPLQAWLVAFVAPNAKG